ncbi:MAG: LysM domain-containing protein [Anaerolineae bacterium]
MKKLMAFVMVTAAMSLVSCDLNVPQPQVTPTFQLSATPEPPTATATFTASATVTTISIAQIQLESPTATFTAGIPTETPTATPTLGPYEHVIQEGETLGYIVQLYGYRELSIYDEIVVLNGMTSPDNLPPPGTTLLIPRQTATPIPEGIESTVSARATFNVNPDTGLPNYPLGCHEVREGETMVGIALDYNMTLEQLAIVNPDISFGDFDEPAGAAAAPSDCRQSMCQRLPAHRHANLVSDTFWFRRRPPPRPPTLRPSSPILPKARWCLGFVAAGWWVSVGVL